MSLKPDAAITELGDQSGIACSGTAKVVEDVDPALACESDDHVQSLLPRSYQREMLEASLKVCLKYRRSLYVAGMLTKDAEEHNCRCTP